MTAFLDMNSCTEVGLSADKNKLFVMSVDYVYNGYVYNGRAKCMDKL